jgi:hypothetical protein
LVRGSEERLDLILVDLTEMPVGLLVLAEGPQLFPELVAAHLAKPGGEPGRWHSARRPAGRDLADAGRIRYR